MVAVPLGINANLSLDAMKTGVDFENKDFTSLRQDETTFYVFYDYIMRGVLGRMEFSHRVSSYSLGSDIATISDEALGLLIVENYLPRWVDMYHKSNGNLRMMARGETMPASWISTVPTRYTANGTDGSEGHSRTWMPEGIARFNDLRKIVRADRKRFSGVQARWHAHAQAGLSKKRKRQPVMEEEGAYVEADNDLMSSDDEEPLHPSRQKIGVDDGDNNSSDGSSSDITEGVEPTAV